MRALLILVLFIFSSLERSDAEENINFCFKDEKHGHRFNGSLLTRLRALSGPECVLHCLRDKCCRSVNYLKTGVRSQETENCELLHVLATDHPEYLIEDIHYDYYILAQPDRPRNCNCLTCDGGTFCLKEKCSCTYDNDGKRQCTDGNFKIFVSSTGFYEYDRNLGHAIIKINGTDYSTNNRGFNFVVVDGENGYVEQTVSFDTHADGAQMMIEFLNETMSKMNKIIIAAVKDDAQYGMTDQAYATLSRITAKPVASIDYRGSFAMIGFSEEKKPSFVKEVQNARNQALIEQIVHIPVINN